VYLLQNASFNLRIGMSFHRRRRRRRRRLFIGFRVWYKKKKNSRAAFSPQSVVWL